MSARKDPPAPRRLEVPVLADIRGNVWAAGVLDVSLCHQGRRVLAESPPPDVASELVRAVLNSGAELARARGDAGAVTVAFAADPATGEIRLLESIPGLPAEHAVLEALTGVDLPAWQARLARGGSLDADLPEPRGHAFQVCLSACDPEDGFAPAPGVLEALRLPSGAGLRADPVLEEGEVPDTDALAIVRLTAHGRSRTEALLRLQQGLAKTVAVVRGGGTDKAFLTELLDQSEIDRGAAEPAWLDRLIASGAHLSRRGADAALLAAAVTVYEREADAARIRYYASAMRGRPDAAPAAPDTPLDVGASAELWYRGQGYALRMACLEPGLFRLDVDGSCLEIKAGPPARTGRRLACGGRGWHVSVVPQGDDFLVEVDGVPHRISGDPGSIVRAPAPAVVVAVPVQEGEEVQAGDPLVVLEAMKMETTVPAPAAGRVRKVLVRRNSQVGTGVPMLVLDPPGFGDIGDIGNNRARPQAGERVRFAPLLRPKAQGSSCRESLLEVRRLVLGYDVESGAAQRAAASAAGNEEAGVDRLIQEILRTYVDLGSLFRRQAEDSVRHSSEEFLFTFLRDLDARGEALPPAFLARLRRALEHYGVTRLDRSPELEESLYRIGISHRRQPRQAAPILALLERLLESASNAGSSQGEELRDVLDRLIEESQGREPSVHDLAREVRYRLFDRSILLAVRDRLLAAADADLAALAEPLSAEERAARIRAVVDCPQPLHAMLSERFAAASPRLRAAILEILVLRYYSRVRNLHGLVVEEDDDGLPWLRVDYEHPRADVRLLGFHGGGVEVVEALDRTVRRVRETPRDGRELALDLYLFRPGDLDEEDMAAEIAAALARPDFPQDLRRVAVCLGRPEGVRCFTFRQGPDGGYVEDGLTRGLHPMIAQRFELWRLTEFRLHRLPAPEGVLLFHGTAHENPKDERLFALSEVRDLTPVRDASGRIVELPQLERMLMEALAGIRRFQSRRAPNERLHWNRVLLYLWPPVDLRPDEINGLVQRLTPRTEGLGLEKVALRCRIPERETGNLRDWVLEISNPGTGMVLRFRRPSEAPLKPLREYAQKVIELRKRGLFHPFDIIRMLTPPRQSHPDTQGDLPAGDFAEHDLDAEGRLVPVDRPPGSNTANLVAGVVRSYTGRYPEGMARVILLGDAGRGMGTLAEPECRLILGALDLAERMQAPLEWFALSAGARISMDSGTENMDWIGLVLRRLVEYTQGGGEVNLVVPGINVGAQPYWNAEATMLMHTRGILVMTPEGAMVLTGKQALDYSGGVSAEDNQGIGGYERIMGPNGQAQYFAHDLPEACRILLRWYEHTWKAPGERFPRPAPTSDPRDRDVRDFPHGGNFRTVGEVLSEETNPGRKKPFDIRKVMGAVIDQDHAPAERWYGMRDAEIGVVWDAHLGGHPVCLLGFESRPLPRLGFVPAYGPDHWTGGTLFPLSAKKIARAINSASGNRPLVVLANLSGFDGSPESMRQWQLEYGAEIGRAVVNFKGPIVFCVISRYHGGAFVVFSNALNDNMEVAALEGTHASVIGGAPAAAVVFAREVDRRTRRDPRIEGLEQEILDSTRTDKAALRARLGELLDVVRSEKLGDLAEEFDHIHSVQRAQQVGSIHHILPPVRLRPYLIEAVERGMEKELAGAPPPSLNASA